MNSFKVHIFSLKKGLESFYFSWLDHIVRWSSLIDPRTTFEKPHPQASNVPWACSIVPEIRVGHRWLVHYWGASLGCGTVLLSRNQTESQSYLCHSPGMWPWSSCWPHWAHFFASLKGDHSEYCREYQMTSGLWDPQRLSLSYPCCYFLTQRGSISHENVESNDLGLNFSTATNQLWAWRTHGKEAYAAGQTEVFCLELWDPTSSFPLLSWPPPW